MTACPADLKYAIEDTVDGLPFDVIYLDEVRPSFRDDLLRKAIDIRHLVQAPG